jgi:hypothetical protein
MSTSSNPGRFGNLDFADRGQGDTRAAALRTRAGV